MRSRHFRVVALGLVLLVAATAGAGDRIMDIAEMLPAKPVGVGCPITDRAAWETLAKVKSFQATVRTAERLSKEPLPDQPDDLYLDFSRNGNRTRWQDVAGKRRGRLRTFALAECLENQGRFIKPLEETIEALCGETTWVMPAHDRSLKNFRGEEVDIDLGSSALAWEMATADYLLGDKLSPRVRALIHDHVRRRILDPFLAMVAGERKRNWWMDTTNNWNSVCLAGVVGSALALVESPEERARFILAAEEYSKNFLRGFGKDGYCSEGLGYWNYGFGYFVLLADTTAQATGGEIDLLENDESRQPALFGVRMEITDGVYPAFADCKVDQQPSLVLMAYLNRRYGLGLPRAPAPSAGGRLFESMVYSFPHLLPAREQAGIAQATLPLRTWFDVSGILICRPDPAGLSRMAVALKGGHNGEHHNHNDVGSFVVALGGTPILLDPGLETYTARTFSSRRYESKVLNSFGHPVPLVAGELQRQGKEARGEVLKTSFSDAEDTLVLDLRSAYPEGALSKLTRTFVYERSGTGSLTVTDEVTFTGPAAFGTALVTLGEWEQRNPNTLAITDGEETLLVHIDTGGLDYEIQAVKIEEDVQTRRLPTRIGIDLKQPVTEARVVVSIVPGS